MVKQSIKFNLKFSPSKKDISFNNGQCTKSYSSHKWKQTIFSKMEYLEIFLQLMRRNRQYIPKRNLLSRHVHIFPVQYPIQEVSHFGCSSFNKVLVIIVEVSWLLGYLEKIDNFILPQECSHILCAHNLLSPAWYIDSYLYWDVKLVPSPELRM